MPKRKYKRTTVTTHTHRKRKKPGLWKRLRAKLPGWSFWLGGVMVVGVCFFLWRKLTVITVEETIVYPEGYSVYGIDVSRYQTAIDWEVLKNQGKINDHPLYFAFIKATEGTDRLDPKFDYNFQQAAKYNISRGAYHFYNPQTSAKAQAEYYIKNVTLKAGDLPPVLDIERRPEGISAETFKFNILEWLSLVEKHYGMTPIIYTYYSFKMQYMNDVVFERYPYWIAHYGVDEVAYKGPWSFWQFSDKGELPGIKGHVDLNVFNGSPDDLKALTKKETPE